MKQLFTFVRREWELDQQGLSTTIIHKIKAHTNIRGNDLADIAAKSSVLDFDALPPDQTLRVEVGSIAPAHPTR